jgi:RNA polymerase sigma-B factor
MSIRRTEERELFDALRASGARRDRDALVERFLPLARQLARRYQGGSEPLEDLEQVASLALVRAVDGFDPTRGTAFSSYAVPSIAGAIKRHFRDHGWSVRVPRDLQELSLRVERLSQELDTHTGRPPSTAEVAASAGVEVEQVVAARVAYRALHSDSLDSPRRSDSDSDDDGDSLLDTMGGTDANLDRVLERSNLDAMINTLDDRDRLIVRLYFQGELTQSQIGARLGLSQMHISRLLRSAVKQLTLSAAEQRDHRGAVSADRELAA